jgi:hypothetical protein
MTDHDDKAAQRGLAADSAGQDLEETAWPQGQEPHGCLRARDGRRKALDGSPLGEPILDWSGINVSTRARLAEGPVAPWSWG